LLERHVGERRHSRLHFLIGLALAPASHPPHLVIEILSPDDEPADMLEKIADYLKFGVQHIWVPSPYRHRLQVADRDRLHRPDLIVEAELAGRVDFGELFAKLDDATN
jgi:Uma2 family endonuclease